MRELDFLPAAYKLVRQRRRRVWLQAWCILAGLGFGLILWMSL